MRKKTPLALGLLLLGWKVAIDYLAQGEKYDVYLLPGEVIFAVLAFDLWAVTEEMAGEPVLNVTDSSHRALVVILFGLHLLVYLGLVIINRDFPDVIHTPLIYFVILGISGVFHLLPASLIAFDYPV